MDIFEIIDKAKTAIASNDKILLAGAYYALSIYTPKNQTEKEELYKFFQSMYLENTNLVQELQLKKPTWYTAFEKIEIEEKSGLQKLRSDTLLYLNKYFNKGRYRPNEAYTFSVVFKESFVILNIELEVDHEDTLIGRHVYEEVLSSCACRTDEIEDDDIIFNEDELSFEIRYNKKTDVDDLIPKIEIILEYVNSNTLDVLGEIVEPLNVMLKSLKNE